MKKLGLFISILIIMLLFGCGEEKPEFSEHITPVLEIMANAPNADYLDPESMLSYGLNSEPSEAEREEAARLTQINDENWEKALGEHFVPARTCFGPLRQPMSSRSSLRALISKKQSRTAMK